MHPSVKKSLAWISILLLLFSGCRQGSFLPAGITELPEIRLPVNPEVDKLTFKARIFSTRSEISGILVIKKTADSSYRIAYFNEMGMSYLEGSMAGTYPYPLAIRSVNPLVASGKTTGTLEKALNLLLIRKKDIKEREAYKDRDLKYWISGKTTGGDQYWGRLDSQDRVDMAFLGNDRNTKALFEYEDDAYPSHLDLRVKDKVMLTLSRK